MNDIIQAINHDTGKSWTHRYYGRIKKRKRRTYTLDFFIIDTLNRLYYIVYIMTENTSILYTEEFVITELTDMLKTLRETPSIFYKKDLFLDKDYSSKKFSQWLEQYPKNVQILETTQKIEDILQSRLVNKGLDKSHSEKMTRFVLTNCYSEEWKEKKEVEHSGEATIVYLDKQDENL